MGWWQATLQGDGVTCWGALGASAPTMLQSAVEETAAALTPFVKAATPVAQGLTFDGTPIIGGALRASLQWEIGTLGAVLLGRGYGAFVIGGTAAHEIRPRTARALAFWSTAQGHGVFRTRVQHPGTHPNDFRQRAVQTAEDAVALPPALDRVLGQWVNDATGG